LRRCSPNIAAHEGGLYRRGAARLDGILAFIAEHYPTVSLLFENRLRAATRRVGAWPESAPEVVERPGVRVLPLIPYPYKLFYRVAGERVEVLHIYHASRRQPWHAER
jgi:toxin ParE1/3/4